MEDIIHLSRLDKGTVDIKREGVDLCALARRGRCIDCLDEGGEGIAHLRLKFVVLLCATSKSLKSGEMRSG